MREPGQEDKWMKWESDEPHHKVESQNERVQVELKETEEEKWIRWEGGLSGKETERMMERVGRREEIENEKRWER